MQKKQPMTLSDHIRLSVRTELARLVLMSGLTDILAHHVNKNSREYKKIHAAIHAIEELQSWMDDIACMDEPDGIGNACTRVYYGVDDSIDPHGELKDVLDNYAVRHAVHLLACGSRVMDADEIVLTRFDSSYAQYIDEERHGEKFLHIKADTGYITKSHDGTISKRPPEDEINPNKTECTLVPCQIRDFCEDAMRSGTYPTDEEIFQHLEG